MTTTPTPADYATAEAVAVWMGHEPRFVRDRLAQIIAAHRAEPLAESALRTACRKLISYRDRNTLNFQLEKADDFINQIRAALEGQPADPLATLDAERKAQKAGQEQAR